MIRLPVIDRGAIIVAGLTVLTAVLLLFAVLRGGGDDDGVDAVDPAAGGNLAPTVERTWDGDLQHPVGADVGRVVLTATDPNGDRLSFIAANLPVGVAIDPLTGIITGTPSEPCVCSVTVSVDDGRGGRGDTRFQWTVTGSNEAALPPPLSLPAPDGADDAPPGQPVDPEAPDAPTPADTTTPPGDAEGATTVPSPTTAAPTTAAPTTAAPTTQAPDLGPVSFHGTRDFDSFFEGRKQYDAWSSGDIAFYAPQGQIRQEDGARWVEWFVRIDNLYRIVSGRSDFNNVYRRGTPDLGSKKVLAIVETCGAGCGSKQQAEADPGYINQMTSDPTSYEPHWIFFYEMGRGGSPEPWYGKATWPKNTVIIPHLMAGIAYHELGGGESGLRRGIPGDLIGELDRWEQENLEYVDTFPIADQQSQNGYTSHHLMPAMLWKVMMETDIQTVGRITANMATKPESTSATQAMCDFQSAVNDATGGQFADRMKGPWGLPDNC
ncbi:MAG: Ig domain-containing protein [Actinomycetota bacterium]